MDLKKDVFNDTENETIYYENYIDQKIGNKELNIEEKSKKYSRKKIKRNQPCPCGSGKKYKNCCTKIEPKYPLEYYFTKIKDISNNYTDSFGNRNNHLLYETLIKANKDHPLNPNLTVMAGLISLQINKPDEALDYLLKHLHLMREETSQETINFIVSIISTYNEDKEAEKILEDIFNYVDYPIQYLASADIKFRLKKDDIAYDILLEGYQKSNKDIDYLNAAINLLKEKSQYKTAFNLLAKDFYRFNLLDEETDFNEADITRLIIDDMFEIPDQKTLSNKEYKSYTKKIVKIFEVIDLNQKLNKKQINQIKDIIDDEIDPTFLIERLLYHLEEYKYISDNEHLLSENSKTPQQLNVSIIRTNYHNNEYSKVVDKFYDILNEKYLETTNREELKEYLKYYLDSLYKIDDKEHLNDTLKILVNFFTDRVLVEIIDDSLLELDLIDTIEIFQYIKDKDKDNYLDKRIITSTQLANLLFNPFVTEYPEFVQKHKGWIKNLVDEYNEYDQDVFIYHFAKWIFNNLSDQNNDKTLKEIIEYDTVCKKSLDLKYLTTIKAVDPKIIIDNPFETDKLDPEELKKYQFLAKLKNNDYNNIYEAAKDSSYNFMQLLKEYIKVMELDELENFLDSPMTPDDLKDFIIE